MNAKELGQLSVSPHEYAYGGQSNYLPKGGITLRQHFAGLFMATMVGDPKSNGLRWDWLAQQSLNATDALLAELAKET